MFVRPAAGRTVRRPDTYALLAEAGEQVPDTDFWHRRLRDGDVEPVDEKASSTPDDAAALPFSVHPDDLQMLDERHADKPAAPEPPPATVEQHDEEVRA